MDIWGDYHTHTIYSHGRGTVEENVLKAISMGIREIGITDHGFRHGAYHVRRMDWPFMKADVERVKKKYPMINIYLGLETNLVHTNGRIDISASDMEDLDILICGYHKYVRTSNFLEFFKLTLPNFVLDSIGKSTQKQTVINTEAYVKAIEKNDIDILSHPNNGLQSDIVEVAKAAKHFGTFLELNGKRVMKDEEIVKVLEVGAMLIVDSDAHSVSRIGEVSKPFAAIERLGIPKESIANWGKLPHFRSKGAKRIREVKKK